MNEKFKAGGLRLNYIRGPRKQWKSWMREQWRELFPRRVRIYRDDEIAKTVTLWMPRKVSRYTLVETPFIRPGEPGYEEATHEFGFIFSNDNFKRGF